MILQRRFPRLNNHADVLKTVKKNIMSDDGSIVGQLEFTLKVKTDGDPTVLSRNAVENMKTIGVMQNVGYAVEGVDNAIGATQAASDQLQPIEAIVSPLVDNMKVFADFVTEFSKVGSCIVMYTST